MHALRRRRADAAVRRRRAPSRLPTRRRSRAWQSGRCDPGCAPTRKCRKCSSSRGTALRCVPARTEVGQRDDRILEALGAVHGHDAHDVVGLLGDARLDLDGLLFHRVLEVADERPQPAAAGSGKRARLIDDSEQARGATAPSLASARTRRAGCARPHGARLLRATARCACGVGPRVLRRRRSSLPRGRV